RRHLAIVRPTEPAFLSCADEYRQLAVHSPLLQYWLRTEDHDRVLRRSDCCNPSQFRQTALYWEVDQKLHREQLIGTWLRPGGGRHLEVAMRRAGRTAFSHRELARLTSLRRHIFRAYVNVCDFQQITPLTRDGPGDDLPADVVELQDTSLTAGIDGESAKKDV